MPKPMEIRGEPILLDEVLARVFGPSAAREMLAATLELNPGLAASGPVLPVGRTILLPDAAPVRAATQTVVDIFG